MKKFYLFCSAGMSTSMLAQRMQKVADEKGLDIEIKAFSDSQLDKLIEEENPDVLLLGPQIKFRYDDINAKYGQDYPVMVIDQVDYGMMNGENVLKAAISEYKKFNE